jgi:hypothetical protein
MICRHGPLIFVITAACFLLSGPVRAVAPGFENVLSAVTLDFTGKGQQERAVLVQNKDDAADLYIYVSKDEAGSESVLALAEMKKGIVFSGSMWGQLPSLDVNGKGSLLIKSGNESIGRDRWTQTLTVIYRNKEFVIGGIAYKVRDTLDPKGGATCDLNLLSGKGLRNGKPIKVTLPPLRLADWSDEKLPKECQS